MSADIMPCGCEGHADNPDLCRYPALEKEHNELREALKALVRQIEIGGFVDSLGHKATMLSAYQKASALVRTKGAS